jgi:hypothetical protein
VVNYEEKLKDLFIRKANLEGMLKKQRMDAVAYQCETLLEMGISKRDCDERLKTANLLADIYRKDLEVVNREIAFAERLIAEQDDEVAA